MPRIADYSVISDNKVALQIGGDIDHDFNFTLPVGAHLGSRSVLAFMLDTKSDPDDLRFHVEINGTNVFNARFNSDVFQPLHEVIGANVLRHGTNNINFVVDSGDGVAEISDVVLWWQRDI